MSNRHPVLTFFVILTAMLAGAGLAVSLLYQDVQPACGGLEPACRTLTPTLTQAFETKTAKPTVVPDPTATWTAIVPTATQERTAMATEVPTTTPVPTSTDILLFTASIVPSVAPPSTSTATATGVLIPPVTVIPTDTAYPKDTVTATATRWPKITPTLPKAGGGGVDVLIYVLVGAGLLGIVILARVIRYKFV